MESGGRVTRIPREYRVWPGKGNEEEGGKNGEGLEWNKGKKVGCMRKGRQNGIVRAGRLGAGKRRSEEKMAGNSKKPVKE
jgi:hypothetical protein